jgi:hypothetical protein
MIGFSGRDMALIIHNGSMLMATLLLLCVLTWVLSHPYRGLIHDAGLYTLQAMSHLHPGTLSGDAFLRFGSQDAFTIFSPLYAWFIQAFGVEPAAAALTLCAQVAVFASAWHLARSVSNARLAMLGVFVLLAIPGFYGADRVFTCIESFLTPRMLAEALVLAGLACLLRERRVLAIALMLLAALFHPIMAVAGCAALLCAMVAIPYPGTACVLAVAGLGFTAWLSGSIDPAWLALIRERSPYLFLGNWHLEDWAPCAVTLATLFAGQGACVEDPARKLCRVVLITTLGGLALTAIACDGLHLLLLTQLQPWRCLWLGTAVAALMLPLVVVRSWQSGLPGRASCVLLLAAWLFASNEFALEVLLLLALTSAVGTRLAPAHLRWVYRGAWLLLVVALAWRVATNLEFSDAYYLEPGVPLWIRRTMSFVHDGSVPAAIGAAVVWLGTARPSRGARVGLAFAATAAALAIVYFCAPDMAGMELPGILAANDRAIRTASRSAAGARRGLCTRRAAHCMAAARSAKLPVGDADLRARVLARRLCRISASCDGAGCGIAFPGVYGMEQRRHCAEPVGRTTAAAVRDRRRVLSGDERQSRHAGTCHRTE